MEVLFSLGWRDNLDGARGVKEFCQVPFRPPERGYGPLDRTACAERFNLRQRHGGRAAIEDGSSALDRPRAARHHQTMQIYKIFRTDEWTRLDTDGHTTGAPVDVADGFIHASTAAQVGETLAKHFKGQTGLILLALEADHLGDALKWEISRGGALFPHLYRDLLRDDVLWHRAIADIPAGHVLPDGVL